MCQPDKVSNHVQFLKDSKIPEDSHKGQFHQYKNVHWGMDHTEMREADCCMYQDYREETGLSLLGKNALHDIGPHDCHLMGWE